MKKVISVLAAVLFICNVFFICPVSAVIDYTCGDHLTWAFDETSRVLRISGTGLMPNYLTKQAPWKGFCSPDKIIVEEGVLNIGDGAFQYMPLTEIELPSSLVRIGSYALSGTSKLRKISFPNGCFLLNVETTALGSSGYLSGKSGAVYIGTMLYSYVGTMPSTYTLRIAEGTTAVNKSACKNMANLTDIEAPDSLYAIGTSAFAGTPWLNSQPNGAVFVGKVLYTYKGKIPLSETDYRLPEGTTGLAAGALQDQTNITTLTMPDSLVCMMGYSLAGTTNLHTITYSNNLTWIDNGAMDMARAESVILPATIRYIGASAFRQNPSLKTVVFAEGYSYPIVDGNWFDSDLALETISLPACVTDIYDSAFYQCLSLKKITIPKSVTGIAGGAFANATPTVYTYKDSYAWNWATDKGLTCVSLEGGNTVSLTSLNVAITAAEELNRTLYTPESLQAVDNALRAVQLSGEETQAQVDAWTNALRESMKNLVYKTADYTDVDAALADVAKVDRSLYTANSLTQLDAALSSVQRDLDITKQSVVSGYALAIRDALEKLQYRPADYSRVQALCAQVEALDASLYTEAALTALQQYMDAMDLTLTVLEQDTVDVYAAEIQRRLEGLTFAEVVLRNEKHGVIVTGNAQILSPKTALTVDLADPSSTEIGNYAVGGRVTSATIFDIRLILGGEEVQPGGMVQVKIPIPEGVDPEKCKVYHVTNDPVSPLVKYASTLDGNYIVFETDHFSEYAILELQTQARFTIELLSLPTKRDYYVGESLDLDGLVVQACDEDGTVRIVTDYIVISEDLSEVGQQVVRVEYHWPQGYVYTAVFLIRVHEPPASATIQLNGAELEEYAQRVKWYMPYSRAGVKLDCVVKGVPGGTVRWESDNSKVTVSKTGTVTNKGWFGARKATITVRVLDTDGNVVATDKITIRFYKFRFQLSALQNALNSI